MEYIYVLECQKNKYFIGKTYNIQIEYNEHLDGTFCDLTKEYKPIGILCIFEETKKINTNIIIGKYILKYGKENIFFIQENYINKNLIKKIIKSNDSTCICKESNHWLNDCKLNTEKDYWKKLLGKVFTSISKDLKDNGICERCGRFGHDMDNCYAKKHIDGSNINDNNDFDFD